MTDRFTGTMDIESHTGRAERMDIDKGTCLGCMKPDQELRRTVIATGHKWRCTPCIEAGK